MIDSKNSYKFYLDEDRKALGLKKDIRFYFLNPFLIDIEIWKFQKALRKCEYLYNLDNNHIIWKIKKFFAAKKFKRLSCILGFTIPPNCFGPGLRIMHRGTIVVNGHCRVGSNCTLNVCVNIGTSAGFINKVPNIGNNVFIGPGAKLYGDIVIADGCAIGANAVVNKSFPIPNSVIIGIPAISKGIVTHELSVH
jgi:serine O-acetyltransferase